MTNDTLTPAPVLNRRARSVFRRAAFWIPIALLAVVVAVVLGIVQSTQRLAFTPFDPTSAAPDGSLALVRVLEEQGVDVREASDFATARREAQSQSTLLFVDPGGYLNADRLAEIARSVDRIVLVEPSDAQLEALAPAVSFDGGVDADTVERPVCPFPEARRAGAVSAEGSKYSVEDTIHRSGRCYPDGRGAFSLVVSPAENSGEVIVLGSSSLLTNARIGEEGNAALALGLLGSDTRLVWYTPGFDDLDGAEPVNIGTLSPEWVVPITTLGIAVFIAAAVWRGRRMGPLVAETLPVVVRSTETMEGRARLYERSGARLRALDALRMGAVSRLARALGLGRSADVQQIVRACATQVGLPYEHVARILVDAEPRDEAEFAALVSELDDLEARTSAALGNGGTTGWTGAP